MCVYSGTRGVTAHIGVVEEAAHLNPEMFRCVMMPLVGMNNFTLLAIATPGDEFNHYSQLMNLMDDNNKPLFKTIRIALTCPACVKKNVDDVCEHRADLIPAWKSRNRMSRIKKVLEADRELNARENLGLIMSRTEYFIDSAWIRRLNGQPRWLPRSSPPLIFTAVDPSGGGARSSYAIVSVMLQHGQCVVSHSDRYSTAMRVVKSCGPEYLRRCPSPRSLPPRSIRFISRVRRSTNSGRMCCSYGLRVNSSITNASEQCMAVKIRNRSCHTLLDCSTSCQSRVTKWDTALLRSHSSRAS